MTTGALERIVRRTRSRAGADQCGLCGADVPDGHRHVLDESKDALLCACYACSLLFEREAAGRGHYRLVPSRRIRLEDFDCADFGVPVGLAFFVKQPDGTIVARYPSPMGTTEWEIDEERWRVAEQARPELRQMQPRVEALLVNTTRGADEHWIVPVDDCYRLVGIVRQEWKGLSGGSRVWPAVETFFVQLGSG